MVKSVIVLADDDSSMREALAAALEANGFEVVSASSGGKAVEIARRREAEAIISDVSMPDGDGFDVLTAVSHDSPEIPVIFVSGHTDRAVRKRALEAGAAAYLLKPISVGQLMTTLDDVLARRRPATR
jgi:two-component system OmpR family response regulator